MAEQMSEVDRRVLSLFLVLAFAISWTGAIMFYLSDVEITSVAGSLLLVAVYMWAPAVAAIIVYRQYDRSIRRELGVRLGRVRWLALAWLLPVALLAVTVAVATLLPEVSYTTDYTAFLEDAGLTEEQIQEALAALDALPVPPAALFVLQGLLAGLTVNAVAALGEELGWRGLMLNELATLGFWKVSLVTGVIWGFWHAPLVLQGHNFPEHPVLGVFVMTAAVTAVTPVYTYVTVRANSVFAAAFLHGSFNGVGSLYLILLTGAGASDILVSPVGAAGAVAALLATSACVLHDRRVAEEPITEGEPLPVWEEG